MVFVNPIELLDLTNLKDGERDEDQIRKRKKRIYAEIELSSNGSLKYHNTYITLSDCQKAFDSIDHKESFDYFYYIANQKHLNAFLIDGDDKFFRKYRHDSIYNIEGFIEFISPFYSYRLNETLERSYLKNDSELIIKIFKIDFPISPEYKDKAFIATSNLIQNEISGLEEMRSEIEEQGEVEDPEDLKVLLDRSNFEALNSLPGYFQSLRNKLSTSLRDLAVDIFNDLDDSDSAIGIMKMALAIDTDELLQKKYTSDYDKIKEIHDRVLSRKEHTPLIKKYAAKLVELRQILEQIEEEQFNSFDELNGIKDILSVAELNGTPEILSDIRNQIALAIRDISISLWNSHSRIQEAMQYIQVALEIDVDSDVRDGLEKDLADFEEIKRKYEDLLICFFCRANTPDEKSVYQSYLYKETNRTWIPRRVKYKSLQFSVPRCRDCAKVHNESWQNSIGIIIASGILGLFIGASIDDHWFIGVIVGIIIGFITASIANKIFIANKGVQDEDYAEQYPQIRKYINEGWSTSEPTA